MNIGLDFDGVMADTIDLKHKMAKEMFGVEGIPSERFKEYMVVGDGYMSKENYRKLMNTVCGDRKIGVQAKAVPGAVEYIKLLKQQDHNLTVISSRENEEFEVLKDWCKQRDLDLKYISVGYGKDKIQYSGSLDVYIDDDLPKLKPLIGITRNLFLLTQVHNINHELPEGIRRVASWEEFYNFVQDNLV